jgi:hypothetical protein
VKPRESLLILRVAFWSLTGAILASVCALSPVFAANSATKPEFVMPVGQSLRLVMIDTDASVSELTTGGLDQPKADWTKQAQAAMDVAFRASFAARGLQIVNLPEMKGDDAKALSNYRNLLKIVSNQAMTHKLYAGEALPTKNEALAWSLGPGVSALGAKIGADYAVTFFSRDSYVSQGRKAAETVASMLKVDSPAGTHSGSMTMIDLKTGDLVWMNVDVQLTGDVRDAEGARVRAEQLLRTFPAQRPELVIKSKRRWR